MCGTEQTIIEPYFYGDHAMIKVIIKLPFITLSKSYICPVRIQFLKRIAGTPPLDSESLYVHVLMRAQGVSLVKLLEQSLHSGVGTSQHYRITMNQNSSQNKTVFCCYMLLWPTTPTSRWSQAIAQLQRRSLRESHKWMGKDHTNESTSEWCWLSQGPQISKLANHRLLNMVDDTHI